jgi:hypothetical protein
MSELELNALKKFYVRIDTDRDGKVTGHELIDGINNLFFRKLKEHLGIYIDNFPLEAIQLFDIERTNIFKLNQIQAIVESSIQFVVHFFRHQLNQDDYKENISLLTRLFNLFLTSDNPAENSAIPELFTSFTERLKRASEARLSSTTGSAAVSGIQSHQSHRQQLPTVPGSAAVSGIQSHQSHAQLSQQSASREERRLSAQMSQFGLARTTPQPQPQQSQPQQSQPQPQPPQQPVDPRILERHRNENFTDEEIRQIERQARDHAQALVSIYPVDREESITGCERYFSSEIIGSDDDPGLTDFLIRNVYAQLANLSKWQLATKLFPYLKRHDGGALINKKSNKKSIKKSNKKLNKKSNKNKRTKY